MGCCLMNHLNIASILTQTSVFCFSAASLNHNDVENRAPGDIPSGPIPNLGLATGGRATACAACYYTALS